MPPSSRKVIGRIEPAYVTGGLSLLTVLVLSYHPPHEDIFLFAVAEFQEKPCQEKSHTMPVELFTTLHSVIDF